MHRPYWQWTARIHGKTITRRLSQTEAELYQEWSPTTASYMPSSPKCVKSQPRPPN
jgi:hypothetical protein